MKNIMNQIMPKKPKGPSSLLHMKRTRGNTLRAKRLKLK